MIILTSLLDTYTKDNNGKRISKPFGNENEILDTIKLNVKKFDNFLFVNDDSVGVEQSDEYARLVVESFKKTLPFKNYYVLNNRTSNNAKAMVESADFIYIGGGHLPSQNEFFTSINLKQILKKSSAVICGGSAGSMNLADMVYCPPEVEGESLNPNFKRFFKGLGKTNVNILPHYDAFLNYALDGKDYISEIIVPDSYNVKIYAICDGSYIVKKQNEIMLYGEGYLISNGTITRLCEKNKKVLLKEIY